MPKKSKNGKQAGSENELWINPNSTLKGDRGDRAWENRTGGIPSASRYLELADIALGLKKPEPKRKRTSFGSYQDKKTEPYAN